MAKSQESGTGKYKELNGIALLWQRVMLVMLAAIGVLYVLNIHVTLRLQIFQEQYLGLFLALVLASCFLGMRPTRNSPAGRIRWYDILLMACGLAVGTYIVVFYPQLMRSLGQLTTTQVVMGTLMVIITLEAVRRAVGLSIVIVVVCCILYSLTKQFIPGSLGGQGIPFDTLINFLFLDPNAQFSMVAIAGTIGLAFILFGQILIGFGGGDFFNDVALTLMGRYRGGSAKAAVIGSSAVGMISGGPVTNVMLVGAITIPMMTKGGYSAKMAGAIEAVASTGGQIMPPVMGIAAFIIAEFLEIPYAEVALAALIPAILYFLSLYIQVDLQAGKDGLKGVPPHLLPSLRAVRKTVWAVMLPVLVLVYTLFFLRLSPASAGVYSALAALVMVPLLKKNRQNIWKKLLHVIEVNGRVLVEIGVILAAAGFIVGTMGISGLGSMLSSTLISIAGSNVLVLLVLSAILSLILGMGMPSVAAYVLVAVTVAPALTQMGIQPLAAHLFVFYFAIISNITPPVAIAAFAAAGLAGESPMRVGFSAFRIGVMAYVIPFIFVFCPSLILMGSATQVALNFISVIIGCVALGVTWMGYFFSKVGWHQRSILGLAAIMLLVPVEVYLGNLIWVIKAIGILLFIAILFLNRRSAKRVVQLQTG